MRPRPRLPIRRAREPRRVYLVAYDVATRTPGGRRRWRAAAHRCESSGRRLQWSVFECVLTNTELDALRQDLLAVLSLREDRLLIVPAGRAGMRDIERHGPDLGAVTASL